ncbi:type VI secretion system-associated protein TagF [Paraburkholderia guartelaensis]|uniref:type VI secretion system-associated protein TagF n=1 Tax=Paraburkholderia guartelaensis TaxID=2546446 RepID=UPI002AB6131A|nr:type VI secretion system-associated protein TagF [Paraburkholderia guartelaensis]
MSGEIMNGALIGAELALPAWYGKLPGAGDFVGRRMQGALARTWEQWLSQGMAAGRATLDAHARLWSFAIPAGSGEGWVQLGCVAPSRDRVGRRYPLVVAQAFAPQRYVRGSGQGARADLCIRLMGAIVRDAIRGALGPEDFDLALAQGLRDEAAPIGGDAPGIEGGWPNLWEYFDPHGMTSFWWTDAGAGAPRTDVHTGGLDAALFQRLFGEPQGGPA